VLEVSGMCEMNLPNSISSALIVRLKEWEQGPGGGPALKSYRAPEGTWTIGWGCTGTGIDESAVWTLDRCEAELSTRLSDIQGSLYRFISGLTWPGAPISVTPGQWDALVSLCYNMCAPANLPKMAPHFWHDFIAGNDLLAAAELLTIDKALINGVLTPLPGLSLRRAWEAVRFLGWV